MKGKTMFNLFKKKKEVIEAPKERFEYETLYLADIENGEKFERAYKEDFDENDDWHCTKKELIEDFWEERVYRYEPYELPLKIEGDQVYSWIKEDEWIRVGRIKRTDKSKLDGEVKLFLYLNIYKYARGEEVIKQSGSPYFGLTVKKTIIL